MTIQELKDLLKNEFADTKLPHTVVSQIRYNKMRHALLSYKMNNPLETDMIIKNIDLVHKSFSVSLCNGSYISLSYTDGHKYSLCINTYKDIHNEFQGYQEIKYNELGKCLDPKNDIFSNKSLTDFFDVLIKANIMTEKFDFSHQVWT